jgi:hypothetical protein
MNKLYGCVPRTKTNAQVLAELDALHALGYRGHVDFVDDNLIGNKKSLKNCYPSYKYGSRRRIFRLNFRRKRQ